MPNNVLLQLNYLELENMNRQELQLDEIPDTIQQTILTVEDEDFYSHNGVNLRATLRALAENVSAGGINDDIDPQVKRAIEAGIVPGPRLVAGGRGLDTVSVESIEALIEPKRSVATCKACKCEEKSEIDSTTFAT